MLPAVLLAAGKSTRMGRSKATLSVDAADTFLTRIVRTLEAAEVEDVVVVVGHEADAIVESVTSRGLSPRFVVNRDYETGQLSSILAGLRAIDRPGVGGMLLTLVDVPLVAVSTVRSVIARYRATHAPIVRPVQRVRGAPGVETIRHGHPVIIDRRLFEALRSANPATGAKPVVRAHVSGEGDVEVEDEGAFVDVDTPEDYLRFFNRSDARR
jgi:molybdenum cofactor cytidylyltransferase